MVDVGLFPPVLVDLVEVLDGDGLFDDFHGKSVLPLLLLLFNSMAADFFESDGADGDETEIEEEIKFYFNDKEMDEISAERLLNEAFYSKGKVVDINDCEWFDKEELLKRNN